MGTKNISSLILEISVPIMISMLIQALYNIVDSYFVMKISENAFTAVSIAFPIQNTMIGVAVGTAVGINSLLSRSLGEKNFELANSVAENGMFLAFCYSIIFFILGLTLSEKYFRLTTDDLEIIDYGKIYLRIVTMGSFGVFVQITMERVLQSTGRSYLTMLTQGIGAIINIILDPILIFGYFGLPALGIAGAAYATIIGQIIGMFVGLYLNHRYNVEVRMRTFTPRWNVIKKIYTVGLPSIILITITSVSISLMNKILNGFSKTAVAAYGIYYKIQSFIFMPIFGLNSGIIPIIAYNYGAKNRERAKKTYELAIIWGMMIMVVGILIFQFLSSFILKDIFGVSDSLLEVAVVAFRTISISFLFAGFSMVTGSLFQSLGNGTLSLVGVIIRQGVGLIPVAYFLSGFGKLSLVWWAPPIAEFIGFIYFYYYMKKFAMPYIERI